MCFVLSCLLCLFLAVDIETVVGETTMVYILNETWWRKYEMKVSHICS